MPQDRALVEEILKIQAPGAEVTARVRMRGGEMCVWRGVWLEDGVRAAGVVVGLVSVSEDLRTYDAADTTVSSLSRVVALLHEQVHRPVSVADMADAAGCSPSTLDRRIRKVFGLSPGQLVLRIRIDQATALLTSTDLPIAEIAHRTGFYDQAAFTRTFGRLTGGTPAQFRRRSG